MVKCGGTPAGRRVAGSALSAKCACVRVVLGVTGGAVHGCALEDAIYVAACTSRCQMFAFKMECELRVVYLGRFPAIRRVTCSALRAKLTSVCVILCMTGSAVHGRAFEDAIYMAASASRCQMLAFEMECKLRMVYFGRFPTIRRVAGSTICSKRAVVEIVFLMAGVALL